MAFETATAANAKKLAFFHFDPSYNDEKLTFIEDFFKQKNENYFFAKEGLEICI
jgi:ribonuclease BN (tRNA processing enzyme)